ncbi:uncharacterized protein YneF (UPF0154 family) [Streptomyces griseochromogenes]|uniref:Uncharacterized protein YneF (UPF0154 family) n=1 Tax=Streptomyces griseochromogenes TaxID=68214 RepID=A0A1B1AWA8_9ACTN|nr:tetraspanin family protein [Streptomyces griseochromogenes]ANP50843.1 hypothetical protein AVL59_15520 [Streptomyces griseochromogenes]MBP2052264.1 uncharacterized protein YneF (UPF0154 family) [Streptomyces griseochromogenes]
MSLAVEIVLIVIGILLLAAALIGSGISRRLMTIPKMHKAPRIVLAILGVVLLAGGAWGMVTKTEQHRPSLAELRKHIPDNIKSGLSCAESPESPKSAVQIECDSTDASTTPEQVWFTLFPDVNLMQKYWFDKATPSNFSGATCATTDDFKKGGKGPWFLNDQSVTVGDQVCYMAGTTAVSVFTDRRYNIVVFAQSANPQLLSDFIKWVNSDDSVPAGDQDATPATPSHTMSEAGH